MIIYVAHAYQDDNDVEKARKAVELMQKSDKENTYICPLTALACPNEIENRIDLISVCDKMVVCGKVDGYVRRETDYAILIHMGVEYVADYTE